MKAQIKLGLMLLAFLPVFSFGQTIDGNLRYINEQFSRYNEYETSFSVNVGAKELICEDEFGILKANFDDVEIRVQGNNIGIFCLNENSKCIRYYGKDGTRKYDSDYSNYTMGLRENDKIISHINTVLSKFSELKQLVTNGSSLSGTIGDNLKYINQQFSLYNGYQTSFNVDTRTKELICEDKFGILKANWSDVEIRTQGNNVGIFCLDGDSKCIRSYDKNGTRKYDNDYSNYTMGLRENDKMIPHINTVLGKFSEIKQLVLSGGSGAISNNIQSQVESELSIINQIFQRSSEYKNVYIVDYAAKTITSKTANCRAIVPVKSGLSVNYYKRDGGTYGEGFYFQNSDNSILESCTSFENYTEKTYEYVNNYNDVQTVIRSLKKIISLLQQNSTTSYSTSNTGSSAASLLSYINEQFRNYNAYNTVYSVDYANRQLIWKNDFGTNYANFNQVEVRVDYQNSWIGVYCLSGDKCIKQVTNSGSTTYYDQYTMSLNSNGSMISHINEVAGKFAELKSTVLGGSKPVINGSSPSNDSDDPDK